MADTWELQTDRLQRELLPEASSISKKEARSEQKCAQCFDESTVQYYYRIYLAALSSPYCGANTELYVEWWSFRIFTLLLGIVLQSMAGVPQSSSKKCFSNGRVICFSPSNQEKVCV